MSKQANLQQGYESKILDSYVNIISSTEGVQKIYLFGSYAYGKPHNESDIDLMVVIDDRTEALKTAPAINKSFSRIRAYEIILYHCHTQWLRLGKMYFK